jgi:hypothetical protein
MALSGAQGRYDAHVGLRSPPSGAAGSLQAHAVSTVPGTLARKSSHRESGQGLSEGNTRAAACTGCPIEASPSPVISALHNHNGCDSEDVTFSF